METRSGGGTWNGTWRRVKESNTGGFSWADTDQQIIFSGNTYTIKYGDEVSETGTFLYCIPGDNDGADSLFIFSRNIDHDPRIVTYLWEGGPEVGPDGYAFLELYNWLWDAMELSACFDDPDNYRWFVKLPYSFD